MEQLSKSVAPFCWVVTMFILYISIYIHQIVSICHDSTKRCLQHGCLFVFLLLRLMGKIL